MITLNDYLYSGDTVLKILQKYTEDLRKEAKKNHNEVDLVHSNFLLQITELLEHNDFLTAQSQKIREFYKYMAHEYPFLAFTFKGRIKSLIRAEEKFNGYVVEYIYDYYRENGTYPSVAELKNKLSCFRDFIAYRIVVCMPRCHLKPGEDQEQASIRYLYEIANVLPGFLEERGFTAESAQGVKLSTSDQLNDDVKPYYRDYICGTSEYGYQSLHITFYDNSSRSYMEVQLRTQKMDDTAEIGHLPENLDGLLLYGGYPELNGKALEENLSMRQEIAAAIKDGMPCLAECGGFMYLHESMEGMDGKFYEMAGVIPGKVWRTPRLTRFGYITLKQNQGISHGKQETAILGESDLGVSPAHEFHYFDSDNCGTAFHASKPESKRGWDCMHGSDHLLAGFPHLYYYANPKIPQAFLKKCLEYKELQK